MNQKLKQLEEAICEVIPEIKSTWSRHTCGLIAGCNGCEKEEITEDARDITLADILIAMRLDEIDGKEITDENVVTVCLMWNKYDNALHLQSEETIDFLHNIICN